MTMDRPEVRRCLDRLPAKVRRGLLAGRWPSRALRSVVSMEALFIAANLLVVAVMDQMLVLDREAPEQPW